VFAEDYDYSSLVFVLGGAFQGKSLLSLRIAHRYTFSGVLGTDYLRDLLRILRPDADLLCSTSRLDEARFNRQRGAVSELLYRMLGFYAPRREKLVVEGIHLSKEFLQYALAHGATCICLDNQRPWVDRVRLKEITTPVTRTLDARNGRESLVNAEDVSVEDTTYFREAVRFRRIHDLISRDADALAIETISYRELDEAFESIRRILRRGFTESA